MNHGFKLHLDGTLETTMPRVKRGGRALMCEAGTQDRRLMYPDTPKTNVDDTISRQAAIEAICKACSIDEDYHKCEGYPETSTWCDELVALRALPSAQPESFENEREKIANALSEKMAYMHTCLNEQDIILGIVGVKRPSETHCNSDCRNEKCESYHYATKELASAEPKTGN